MTITAQPILADYAEAAQLLSVHPEQIRQWVEDGAMPAPIDMNGNRRFILRDLERWAESIRSSTPI